MGTAAELEPILNALGAAHRPPLAVRVAGLSGVAVLLAGLCFHLSLYKRSVDQARDARVIATVTTTYPAGAGLEAVATPLYPKQGRAPWRALHDDLCKDGMARWIKDEEADKR